MKTRLTHAPTESDLEEIKTALRDFNRNFIPKPTFRELGIFVEDENGKKLAGIVAETVGYWMYIKMLWVDETLRGKDVGTQLIREAEEEAKARGCRYSLVDTFSFQARPFYERMGYSMQMALEDYIPDSRAPDDAPSTHTRFFLTKTLS
ncbi:MULTISPECIES: GNAT family N-acetyltransferase [Rahnella]|jgi:GNAT superfamily N-acetyltransferase|uniref:GNAT family N-acetyltransferase n=1 Tax=Rahnella sp. (strain Y9602) TaxID=2703885 RepID=A0ABW6C4Y4_RAHSY|nr:MULTISPECIES: GNAT family N-acetyltransferase [Rahnella]AFE56332.1 N-acetyltransferase GCN5 [Rahnella aquatilis HX2]AYA05078.1 N-acetyltransferase [Rahnella aquatilis]AZP40375.1 GNAT family N-acetyltransferase [Rahnella aquatilis]AZP44717.1 GNAT family N-acetyltransferase [Rahnella aquatilis]AZP49056.1 GNAT family N-acetyltransferase [Rahnella aquatilis]